MSDGTDDLIRLLSRRAEVLKSISSGCRRRRDLRREMEIADSTVYKSLRELRENDLIKEDSGGYSLTTWGESLLQEYESLEDLCFSKKVISCLGDDFETSVLKDADILLAEPYAPQKPIGKLEEMVEQADRVKGLTPVILKRYVDNTHRIATEGDIDMEFVIEKRALEHALEKYPEKYNEVINSETRFIEVEEEIPFGLAITDDGNQKEICVVVYDDDGAVRGAIFADSDEAVEWAEEKYNSFKSKGERVEGEV